MNFVVAAYALIWIFFFLYVFSIGRGVARLEKELAELKK